METQRDYPLAAFCSYGTRYKSFRTAPVSVREDTEYLLGLFGVPAEVRRQVQAALCENGVSFSAGFRFDPVADHRDPARVVVYVSSFIPVLDAGKPSASGDVVSPDTDADSHADARQGGSAVSW
ncbi:MAG: hypothetical protein PHO92_04695 [Candidatus Peribacteraceae bacterium]|nr:hypothetical protein [Candidatus Peribacteraceae bacterium]